MKCIIRIYNQKTKEFITQIEDFNDSKSVFRNWIIKKKKKDQTMESLLNEFADVFVGFYHYVTDIEPDMICGKIEIIIKNKKPKIIVVSTNILFEYTCMCCLDTQSISRSLAIPNYNADVFQYYFIEEEDEEDQEDEDELISPLSVFNKYEFSFTGSNYWQRFLINTLNTIRAKDVLGLN
jgi:hypothetical protein